MLRSSTILALAALLGAVGSAAAQSRVEIGALECRGTTQSFVVGSVTEMSCVFKPGTGGSEPYHATIRRAGLDIGINETTAVAWAVFAPTQVVGRGDLQGNYGGVSASAAIGVGAGANALVGGSNNSFALQPLSVQGQTGLSIAAGIAGLELRAGR